MMSNHAKIRVNQRTYSPTGQFFTGALILFLVGVGSAYLLGEASGKQGLLLWMVSIGAIVFCLVLLLRWYECAVVIVLAVHLYVDWYLGFSVIALVMALGLLLLLFLISSPEHPWLRPRNLWLWGVFGILALYPAWKGSAVRYDVVFYYPNIIIGSLLFFWLGFILIRNPTSVRILFHLLAGFGTLIALHTIIQAHMGITLFAASSRQAFLAGVSNYQLGGVPRVGSFFVDPNWNGTFFATIIFIPIGLLFTNTRLWEKFVSCLEIFLMLLAVLSTYSNGAWVGIFAGVVVFVFIVGHKRYRIMLPLIIIVASIALELLFPKQINLQIQHAFARGEVAGRWSIWETAFAIIKSNPLTGVGFGHYNYLQRAAIYQVPAQHVPEDHPHNSYLEFAAMAGIPVLIMFIVILANTLWGAFYNQAVSDAKTRNLIVSGIAGISALTINSLTINGWTLPPLAATGWLILGAISSPLLIKMSCK